MHPEHIPYYTKHTLRNKQTTKNKVSNPTIRDFADPAVKVVHHMKVLLLLPLGHILGFSEQFYYCTVYPVAAALATTAVPPSLKPVHSL